MKKIIASISAITLVLLLSVGTINAKGLEKKGLEGALKNSVAGLDSDINGLVESVIYNVTVFKSVYPNENYKDIVEKLNELAVEGPTPAIRYKAQLASLYINYYSMFDGLKINNEQDVDKYFRTISTELENKVLASN